MDEFSYSVALEKWLSVWNDTCGADKKITAKCLAIGQPDINWPVSYWDRRKAWGMEKRRGKTGAKMEDG